MAESPGARPVSRREFGRSTVAATLGGSLVLSFSTRGAALAQAAPAAARAGRGTEIATGVAPIRIGSNENPYGLGPAATAAFIAGSRQANRYPQQSLASLIDKLARLHEVARDRILVTPGSGEILRAATRAFTSARASSASSAASASSASSPSSASSASSPSSASSAGPSSASGALVAAAPTFESPERVARSLGAPVVAVPVTATGALDLTAMAARGTGAGLFFICNPNNPTGGINPAGAVTEFVAAARRAAPDAVILIDEAYFEYVDDPSYATAIPLAAQDPRVIVSRTFSKIHGMAGLRVGYAIGHPETLAAMRAHLSQNTLAGPSAAAALASLDDREYLAKQVALNREARAFTTKAFETAGYTVLPSHANFVMVDVRRDASGVQALCREAGVLIARAFPPMTTYARVSIGTLDEMKQAMGIVLPLLAAPASAAAVAAGATADGTAHAARHAAWLDPSFDEAMSC